MSQPQLAASVSSTSVSGLAPVAVDGLRDKRKPGKTKDGGWGWIVVLGSCICHFFLIGINRSMGIIYLLLQEQFDATGKETALAASIFVSFRALGGPVASKLTDHFGCRAVTMMGGILLCIGFLFSAFAINIINVYITFGVVAGIGGVLVFSPSYIAVSHWFDKKKGKAMSFSTLGTGFGSIVMAPTLMALVSYYGYFGTMLIIGALMLNNSVGGALYRRPPKISGLQKVSVVEVKVNRSDGNMEKEIEESLVVAEAKCVIADGKIGENEIELRVTPNKKAAEKTKELSEVPGQKTSEKVGNADANKVGKTGEQNRESAEGGKSSELGVILIQKSLESGVNFDEKIGEKFVEADQTANHVSLENSQNPHFAKCPKPNEHSASTDSTKESTDLAKAAPDDTGDTDKLGNPHPSTNVWADNQSPHIIMSAAVDTKVPILDTQPAFIEEAPMNKSTLKDAENNLVENRDIVRLRCLDRCPSTHGMLSFFKSSLWFNVPFILYCALVTTTQGCIQLVLVFLPGCGRELGGTRQQASLLLTVFGVADMVGRFVFGFIFDLKPLRSRRTHLYTAVAASFATLAILLGFMPSLLSLAVVTALVAFFEGGAHSQRATNVTELVEPSQMSTGVGLVLFSQGVGNFYGPLVGGVLKDRTGSYSNSFIFGGTTLLCACLLTVLYSVVRYQVDKQKNHEAEHTEADVS